MPNIVIFVSYDSDPAANGMVQLQCRSRASGVSQDIGFYCTIDPNSNASTINAAIISGAIAEFGRMNPVVTVSGPDKKTIFGGAV